MINCKYCKIDKPASEFYLSTIRRDGKSGDCKECIRAHVKANRAKNAEYYREFDRQRSNLPHRVQARKDYAQSDRGKDRLLAGAKAWRKRNPASYQAHTIVNNAIRDGKMHKPPSCSECSSDCNPHGHHCDYNKPLDVMWLCEPCHKEWHRNNTPIYATHQQKGI